MVVPETEIIASEDGVERSRIVVGPGDYVIGRDAECQLQLDVALVSRRHAQLTINYDHALIEDLGSSNGTFVNGKAVTEATRLWPNQKIQVGAATIELRRIKAAPSLGVSLAPQTAAVRRILPEEFLREKKYEIGGVVAQGGMGAILDAKEATIERKVAMKVMLDSSSPDDLARFIAEAKITGQLEHPSIVPIYELGVDENDQVFYTMKFVRGITLKKILELMADGRQATVKKYPLGALLTVFQKVCDAIAFAHSRGVIHRDLKPENIMLGDYGEVLVMDWGLAKILDQSAASDGQPSNATAFAGAGDSGGTMAGSIMGTPAYMSPEQARGEVGTLDAGSDIYALGAILFELLHLRPAVTGDDPMAVVEKVAQGSIEWTGTQPTDRPIPASLLAVCRKACAPKAVARYASVEDLQADVLAYQNGFATRAENAGAWRQLTLLVKRHKAAAMGVAAVLIIGGVLGTKAVIEGRRANAALMALKKSAPALLQLAGSEADSQRFDSALRNIEAALTLDPALRPGRWQRAWVLLGMERWTDAADALRTAREHDSAGAKLASILPAVEKMAAAPSDVERWKSDTAREVFVHLQSAGATGPALAFSGKIKIGAAARLKVIGDRLLATLGKGNYTAAVGRDGLIILTINDSPIRSLESLRGLPLDRLDVIRTLITDLEPLRGMPLQTLSIYAAKITDISALQGMPLRSIALGATSVHDLSPLKGMRLQTFFMGAVSELTDISPLAGMPLTEIDFHATGVSRLDALRGMPLIKLIVNQCPNIKDWSPLKGAPLEILNLAETKVSDISFVEGMPLHTLSLSGSLVRDLTPLRGMPLESLSLGRVPVTDISALRGMGLKELRLRYTSTIVDFSPVLTLPRLETFSCSVLPKELLPLRESKTLQVIDANAYLGEGSEGARPVAEFWAAYDAHQKGEPK